jgi:hypothetical protein
MERDMNLIEEAFNRLFPEKEFKYQAELEYNLRLGDFNANISMRYGKITVHLNLQWKDIDEEIKIGLIQHLLLKIFKRKKTNTNNIELYNNFVKNIPILIPKTKSHPTLEQSFHRVNNQFFGDSIEQPNLQWGQHSFRKLASYNFHNDTITVSTIFEDSRDEVLDYLMYHELLHKYHKFKNKGGRSAFHTREFKEAEELYPYQKEIEKELTQIIRNKKRKKTFNFLSPFQR